MDDNVKRLLFEITGVDIGEKGVYREERIAPPKRSVTPAQIIRMRRIGKTGGYHSDAWLFFRQGKFMENYEDDYSYQGSCMKYFPTYAALTDEQLRGYFSWRTKVRRGIIKKAPASFAYIYIYELINHIGVKDSLDGLLKLRKFYKAYQDIDKSVAHNLEIWITDFIVYYSLPVSLLDEEALKNPFSPELNALINYNEASDDELFSAIRSFSTYNLSNSRFYKSYSDDFKAVAVRSYRAYCAYYEENRGKNYAESLFVNSYVSPYYMFRSAVFLNRIKREDYEYKVNDFVTYRCNGTKWSVSRVFVDASKNRKEISAIMRAIDSTMRKKYKYGHMLKGEIASKEMEAVIEKEIISFLKEKEESAKPKIEIDVTKLDMIRSAAEHTREKLTEYEEPEIEEPPEETEKNETPLTDAEYAFLRTLLYEGRAVAPPGTMVSLLVDSINEKMFDTFSDNIIDFDIDTPFLFEDYTDELKGLVK